MERSRFEQLGGLPRTWIQRDSRLARAVARPLQSFLAVEAAGGVALVVATVVALAWANSAWGASYETIFHSHVVVSVGGFHYDESLTHVINDGLMTLFFFVVGLEIKREWVAGELRDRRAAVLPAVAALGGMVVPAAIYAALNSGGSGSEGWGIPMATDIAFALGVVAVLGSRVPTSLKVFLLTLAIVDDIGAIVVIAVFYTEQLSVGWLAAAVGVVALVIALRRGHVRHHGVYIALGVALWFCVLESGIHATIAGVVMGLLTPALPWMSADEAQVVVDELEGRSDLSAADVHRVSLLISESVPLTERIEYLLHPWTSYLLVPLFALANAGIVITGDSVGDAGDITIGIVLGLVVGKTVGISLFSWIALRLRVGHLPEGVRFSQLAGMSMLAGIGFTVSLFVSSLAFGDGGVASNEAKIGILVASLVAAVGGSAVLFATGRGAAQEE